MNKKLVAILSSITIIVLSTGYYFLIHAPYKEALSAFDTAKQEVVTKNKEVEDILADATKTIEQKEAPLEAETLSNLENSINKSKQNLRVVPEASKKTDELKKQTEELQKPIDYTDTKNSLSSDLKKYKDSITQLKQITAPSQNFVEERLKEIKSNTEVKSVTESNDPNGQLNKQGGYVASVYFINNQVKNSVPGSDAVDKGNDAGGNVEVYKTKEEAEKRNTYLSAFDGQGMLNPGSHYVHGTLVIRTSSHLTASQQNELTKEIYNKLIELR